MTTATICTNCSGFSTLSGSNAVSNDFRTIAGELKKAIDHIRDSTSYGWSLKEAIGIINEIKEEANIENWDSYGAKPVKIEALNDVRKFIEFIPSSIPLPDIMPEPDGDVGIEWRNNKNYIFSISFPGNNKIIYAGVFGINETHGIESFTDTIPKNVMENIRRLAL